MATWAEEPKPPEQPDPDDAPVIVAGCCWCGRPLEATPLSTVRWACPEHGPARYAVVLTQRDGNPVVVYRGTELVRAHEHADVLRELWAKDTAFVGVIDEDDMERGWL